jgi:proton-translocating NAD(P)+ transhydrogenase subunit alpha
MSESLLFGLYIFVLAGFLGHHVISKVPPLLHTPLMAGTNAISGISLVGSLVAAGAEYNTVSTVLGFVAVTCATINMVGGFLITDRMLRMFRKRPAGQAAAAKKSPDQGAA